ncbi:SulP family inorganic anion transporter [Ilumatobacter nonamiensis]|uniref:SulP family inorganic anion transporter n=1 Tax=Ilumatobacter nonamiensis TaxID=467093 RepID=UPI00130E2A3E|nr:sulfate permease [Ilumatobacter nonamiensis]
MAPGIGVVAAYDRRWLRADVLGGLTLWAMLVPQSLGFAVLAGLPPVVGLYAAIASMVLYWLWGSSRFLNVGAESTVAIMLATILSAMADPGSDEYVDLAMTMGLLVGAFLLLGGVFRLGRVADLLSRPVLAGYVFGSGVLIVTSQLQGFLGTDVEPDPYLTEIGAVARNIDEAQMASIAFGVATLVVMLTMRKFVPAIPGALVAVAGCMLVVAVADPDVAVVGAFDGGLPVPGIPSLSGSDFLALIGPALAVALLVYPDSVLTARSLTYGTSDRVDANREFFGIGAANVGAGLLGAFPVNGSQSRSFVLADSGAKSQVANLAAAFFVLLTLVFLAPVFDYLPVATLAAIVIVAGFGLFDLAEFGALWRYRRSEFWMAIVTVAAVLGVGMLIGIVIAILLSLLAAVLRDASPHTAVLGRKPGTDTFRDIADHPDAVTFPGLLIYRFDAPLFFANAPFLRDDLIAKVTEHDARAVVFDMESVQDVDSTGAQALDEVLDELGHRGITMEFARVKTEVRDELQQSGVEARLAGIGVHLEVDDAVTHYLEHLAGDTDANGTSEQPQ